MHIQYTLGRADACIVMRRGKFDGRAHTFSNHIIRTSGEVGVRQEATRDLHVNNDDVVIAIAVVDGGDGGEGGVGVA